MRKDIVDRSGDVVADARSRVEAETARQLEGGEPQLLAIARDALRNHMKRPVASLRIAERLIARGTQ